MRVLCVLVAAVLTTGCAFFPEAADRVARAMGNGMVEVCDNFDQKDRDAFLNKVNEYGAPHDVALTCRDENGNTKAFMSTDLL